MEIGRGYEDDTVQLPACYTTAVTADVQQKHIYPKCASGKWRSKGIGKYASQRNMKNIVRMGCVRGKGWGT